MPSLSRGRHPAPRLVSRLVTQVVPQSAAEMTSPGEEKVMECANPGKWGWKNASTGKWVEGEWSQDIPGAILPHRHHLTHRSTRVVQGPVVILKLCRSRLMWAFVLTWCFCIHPVGFQGFTSTVERYQVRDNGCDTVCILVFINNVSLTVS